MIKRVSIIGSGFSSLSAACYLAAQGFQVDVYEKNAQLGGRARQYVHQGFKFDMGPTWYWMPDVFDRFFGDFGKKTSDYYELNRLAPAYRVYFGENDTVDIGAAADEIADTFEGIEPGSSEKLKAFLERAKSNYDVAIKKLVYKPGLSPFELVDRHTVVELKQFFLTIRDYVSENFKDPRLVKILEFPVLFLGAKPSNTPLFYSFMNYADFGLGTWYPTGGMKSVVDGLIRLAKELGVVFHQNATVTAITVDGKGKIDGLVTDKVSIPARIVISGADYQHSESLLSGEHRSYGEAYWSKKTMAPSSLLFYVGFSKKIKNVLHHTLFFDSSFDDHAAAIYDKPAWPEHPLFYASFPSLTDDTIVPEGKEAATFLIPLAPDLEDSEEIRERYFKIIMERLEKLTGQHLMEAVLFKKSYGIQDFKDDYNSYRGNAYGLANTLMQTAFMRPKMKSKKVGNLYFTGQLTVPGPGVPPALISGKLVSDLVIKANAA
jgi:phytoene desaturase